MRAYSGLRANAASWRCAPWLYRIAHNRCVDELRRPQAVAPEAIDATVADARTTRSPRLEQRDALRRLIADVQRLPEQQRSALLMRELGGMTYADVAGALGVSVPAVKSLLVRARVGLAQANEARDTACAEIREDLIVVPRPRRARQRPGPPPPARLPQLPQFRTEVRGVSRQLAALTPTLGPIGVIAKLLGSGRGGGAAAGSGAVGRRRRPAAATGAAGGLARRASVGAGARGAGHVVTLLAAAVVTAGGAVELQHMLRRPLRTRPPSPRCHRTRRRRPRPRRPRARAGSRLALERQPASAAAGRRPTPALDHARPRTRWPPAPARPARAAVTRGRAARRAPHQRLPPTGPLDPDHRDAVRTRNGAQRLIDPATRGDARDVHSASTRRGRHLVGAPAPTPAPRLATGQRRRRRSAPRPTAPAATGLHRHDRRTGTARTGTTGTSGTTSSSTGSSSTGGVRLHSARARPAVAAAPAQA